MADFEEEWFDLKPLGFPGWEHTRAFRITTDTKGRGTAPWYLEVRMKRADFAVRLIGRDMLKVVADHIEGVETLIRAGTRSAAP